MAGFKLELEAIGTKWIIECKLTSGQSSAKLSANIKSLIEQFDKNYSRFRNDSWVYGISQKQGKYILPKDGKRMLDLYQKLYSLTEGKFTPLIGSALVEAGYDSEYSFQAKE